MPCKSPIYRIPTDTSNFSLLSPYDRKRERSGGVMFFGKDFSGAELRPDWDPDLVQKLSCGQCAQCRLGRSKEWAVRCSLEASMHQYNYFVTLTYDDYHLPRPETDVCIDYNGDVWDSTLRRRDIQLFVKNLREYERDHNGVTGLKIFYCGEYGDLNGRPHFHICIFGCSPIPDLTLRCVKKNGKYRYYKSVLFEKFWSEDEICRGFVDITDLSFDTVAYTARYVMKKQGGKIAKDFIDYYNSLDESVRPELRPQPFIGYSNRPGIAAEYFHNNKLQITLEDRVKYQKAYELYSSKPPRYFDKLFDREDPEEFAATKQRRVTAGLAAAKTKSYLTSEDEISRAFREEDMVLEKEKKYRVRNL